MTTIGQHAGQHYRAAGHNLSYGGSNHPVLDGVNITVCRGSIYGLLGPIGCGKTSVLNLSCVFTRCQLNLTYVYFQIILGLIKPGSGSIVVSV